MKTLSIFLVLVLSPLAYGNDRNSEYIYKCIKSLLPHMQDTSYEIPNRGTVIAMFTESHNGMFARADESANSDGVVPTGALLIERHQVHLCHVDWNYSTPTVFKITDTAGSAKVRFQFGQKDQNGKLSPFEMKSRFTMVSRENAGKVCQTVSAADRLRSETLLKKMILSAAIKEVDQKGKLNSDAEIYCRSVLGIKSSDIPSEASSRSPAVVEPGTER